MFQDLKNNQKDRFNIKNESLVTNKKAAFTLTEVLLAVAIVGIIAALVLPSTISKFNTAIIDNGFDRQIQAIQTAVDVLPSKENKTNFGETSMYSDGTKSYDETSGKFMKRYLRVSKYYGDYAANEAKIKRECFAKKYYEYSDGEKKDLDISSLLLGACAKLKNGASLCLTPQIGTTSHIQGLMDINGPKGPNIYGRDLRKIGLSKIAFSNYSSKISDDVSTEVYTTENPNLDPEEEEDLIPEKPLTGCKPFDFSTDCCRQYAKEGLINSANHGCCSNPNISAIVPVCNNTVYLNIHIDGRGMNRDCYDKYGCQYTLWATGSGWSHATFQDKVGVKLPASPPGLRCWFGYNRVSSSLESSVVVKNIVEGIYNDEIVLQTTARNSDLHSPQGGFYCTFTNGQNTIEHNGYKWKLNMTGEVRNNGGGGGGGDNEFMKPSF